MTAAFHTVDLDTGRQVAHQADDLVVTASVFKLPVLIELCRQHATGQIDAARPVPVPVPGRAPGPTGLSVMQDPTTISLRDLAWLMMGISDNGASDVICQHVGLENVHGLLRRLGLVRTGIDGDCRDLYRTTSGETTRPVVHEVDAVDLFAIYRPGLVGDLAAPAADKESVQVATLDAAHMLIRTHPDLVDQRNTTFLGQVG